MLVGFEFFIRASGVVRRKLKRIGVLSDNRGIQSTGLLLSFNGSAQSVLIVVIRGIAMLIA